MACERVFLGWEALPLEAARAWLLRRAERVGPSLDLTALALCVPTARAGRLLLNVLIDSAARAGDHGTGNGGVLLPPSILTPGALVEALGTPRSATALTPASPLALRLAWKVAIESLGAAERRAICGGITFGDGEPLAIASLVERSHARLTSQLATFDAALRRARSIRGGELEARLSALARAEREYERVLGEAGLCDAALGLARAPVGSGGAFGGGAAGTIELPWRSLVLVGLADMPRALRRALGDFEGLGGAITSLVFAPPSLSERFDEFGGVGSAAWGEEPLDLGRTGISIVETADELVDLTLGAMGELPSGTSTSEVVLGVTDASVAPVLVRRAARAGVDVRPAVAGTVADTPTASLLRGVLELLREGTFREWGTLLRHPWFERAVRAAWSAGEDAAPATSERWLEELDRYVLEHLPNQLGGEFLRDKAAGMLARVLDATLDVLGGLAPRLDTRRGTESDVRGAVRSISAWSESLRAFLARVVPESSGEADDAQGDAEASTFEAALGMMASLDRTPTLDLAVGADAAVQMLLELASDAPLPPRDVGDAVEAVGWLELPMDPAAHVVVVGLSEGVVPLREVVDPLVPAAVHRALGLEEPVARLARDAYLLSLLAHSRRSVRILLSRAGADGEPTLPSRLLFHADEETLLARARLWSPRPGPVPEIAKPPSRASRASTGFSSLRVEQGAMPERWRVTAFRDYLASPYLFYLRHVARVEELDPVEIEVLPHRFGTLVHEVLKEFGRSDVRGSADAGEIAGFLRERFERQVLGAFGPAPTVPLWVQGQQALARLEEFARWQSGRVRGGWRIEHTEWSPGDEGVGFEWEKGEIRLTGRIDRVDRHPTLGVALIDYKLQGTARSPEKAHWNKKGWIDLQLPLYRHLARSLLDGPPVLAYVTLAADGEADLRAAAWDGAMLESADEVARSVIAAVHRGEFRDKGPRPPTGGTLGALAGFGHLGGMDGADDEDGEGDE